MSDKELQEYNAFLEQKKQTRIESGFTIEESELNPMVFPFQKYCVKRALQAGKFGVNGRNIRSVCDGQRKHCGGFRWRWDERFK